MKSSTLREKYIHEIFVWGVILKALDGVLEMLGGIALLFPTSITRFASALIHHELIQDPHDFIAAHIEHYLPLLTAHVALFAALYLISHGVIKVGIVAGLLRDKLWAYPTAIIVFSLFIIYQMYRFAFTHSITLIVLTILDFIVIGLTWHEYRYYRSHHRFPDQKTEDMA